MSIFKTAVKRYALAGLSATLLLSPAAFAATVTVDNLDPSVIKNGIWSVSGGANPYGQNSEYAPESTASIQWPISVPETGRYQVQAYWTEWANRTSQADYLISNGRNTYSLTRDQKQNGGQWVTLIDDYDLIAGDMSITLTNGNGGTLSGDAVRIVSIDETVVGTNAIVVDNDDATVTRQGGWAPSSGANPYGGASEFTTIGTFGWEATLPDAGQYIVEAYWTYYNNRTDQAAYEIQHVGGVDTVTVDQKENAGEWVELGVYDFNAGPANILLSNAAGAGTLSADAVRFTKVYLTDNGDGFVAESDFGPIANPSRLTIEVLDGNNTYGEEITGHGSDIDLVLNYLNNIAGQLPPNTIPPVHRGSFYWDTNIPNEGSYNIQVFIPAINDAAYGYNLQYPLTNHSLAEKLSFEVFGQSSVVELDTNWGFPLPLDSVEGGWHDLGVYQLDAGSHRVTQSMNCFDCAMFADAVRYIPTDAAPVEDGPDILYFDNQGIYAEREGTWARSGGANPYDGHSEYSTTGSFTWDNIGDLASTAEGQARYELQAYWTGYSNRTSQAQYEVTMIALGSYNGLTPIRTDRIKVDQRQDGGKWVTLGAYDIHQATLKVTLSNLAGGTLSADALRLVPLANDTSNRLASFIGAGCGFDKTNSSGDTVSLVNGDSLREAIDPVYATITSLNGDVSDPISVREAPNLLSEPNTYPIPETIIADNIKYAINDGGMLIFSWIDLETDGRLEFGFNRQTTLNTLLVDPVSGERRLEQYDLGITNYINHRVASFCDDLSASFIVDSMSFGDGSLNAIFSVSYDSEFIKNQLVSVGRDDSGTNLGAPLTNPWAF